MERIRRGESGVQWTSLWRNAKHIYGVPELWEAKASHGLRMLTSGRVGTVQVVDFTRRGDSRVFRHE